MCEYCKYEDEDGKEVMCGEFLLSKKINCGLFGKIQFTAFLSEPISECKHSHIAFSCTDDYYVHIKINYCPMCGRKLGDKG